MTNNDILRRIRFTFDLKENDIIKLFALADEIVDSSSITSWLKKDDDPAYVKLKDRQFSAFLNGFITSRRGKRDGVETKNETSLNNNMIFQKLRIALHLNADDVLEVLALADFNLSKHELSAFFRKPGTKNFRECKDQVLRNFLMGLQLKVKPK